MFNKKNEDSPESLYRKHDNKLSERRIFYV